MKINLLDKNFSHEVILYSPELELQESPNVAEKCYPAVRVMKNDPLNCEYFYLLVSEVGNYEEYERHPGKGYYYENLGGKKQIEKKLQELMV